MATLRRIGESTTVWVLTRGLGLVGLYLVWFAWFGWLDDL